MAKRSRKTKSTGSRLPKDVAETKAPRLQLPSWTRDDWFLGAILFSAVFLIYIPVFRAGYIWDDDLMLTANPVIVGPLGFKEIWTTSAAEFYPLVLTTLWAGHALWGLHPLPYHLLNVFMHGCCVAVLWQVLRSLRIPCAWLGAALWAVHPVQVETVAWVTELKNTQSCLFYLLSILFFVKWLNSRELPVQTAAGGKYTLALIFALMAMMSKTSTVILPLVLCLCAWWLEGRLNWRSLVKTAPIFVLSLASALLSLGTKWGEIEDPHLVRTWPERLAVMGDAIWFYLGKLVWPHPLIAVYPRWNIDAQDWRSYLPLVTVIIVWSVLWLKRDSWARPWFFTFTYFVIALLPVIGLVNFGYLRYSFVADHFQYLACIGPLALVGAGVAKLQRPAAKYTLAFTALLVLALISWQRAWVYQNEETLWTDTLAQNPDCWVGANNLGSYYSKLGRLDDAIVQLERALYLNPDYPKAQYNLATALFQMGRIPEATEQFKKAVNLQPDSPNAHNSLGVALLQSGHLPEAVEEFEQAIRFKSDYAEAHANLGRALMQAGQIPEAIGQFHQALSTKPDDAAAHDNLGIALVHAGRISEAIEQFAETTKLKPNYADGHNHMGLALEQTGDVRDATAQFEMALNIDPGNEAARKNLLRAQAESGATSDK